MTNREREKERESEEEREQTRKQLLLDFSDFGRFLILRSSLEAALRKDFQGALGRMGKTKGRGNVQRCDPSHTSTPEPAIPGPRVLILKGPSWLGFKC